MSPQLTTATFDIDSDALKEVGDARLADARALMRGGRCSGAVYLAGYCVECYLKAAICRTLDVARLPKIFGIHDLETLLLYSGLERLMKEDKTGVHHSFAKVVGSWKKEGVEVRYGKPSDYKDNDTASFLAWVDEVVAWIKLKTD